MKILFLTIKKGFFDLIKSGEKKEEYRDVKPYFDSRLAKNYDAVVFCNGYSKCSPTILVEFKGVEKREENGRQFYVIKLGSILN